MTAASLTWSRPTRSPAQKRGLPSILREEGVLRTEVVVDIVFDVCDSLSSLHTSNIVHGDLGPHCIKLVWPRRHGELEIFALDASEDSSTRAVHAPHDPRAWHFDRAAFVAPEQRAATRVVDARADVYAVGRLLEWLLGGAPRPRTLGAVVSACVSPDPLMRPQSIDELAEKIASFASSPPECFERLADRRRRTLDAALALAREEARDSRVTLDRLEQLAVERETPRVPPVALAPVPEVRLDRLITVVAASTGAPPPHVAKPHIEIASTSDVTLGDDDLEEDDEDESAEKLDALDVDIELADPSDHDAVTKLATAPLDYEDDAPTTLASPLPPSSAPMPVASVDPVIVAPAPSPSDDALPSWPLEDDRVATSNAYLDRLTRPSVPSVALAPSLAPLVGGRNERELTTGAAARPSRMPIYIGAALAIAGIAGGIVFGFAYVTAHVGSQGASEPARTGARERSDRESPTKVETAAPPPTALAAPFTPGSLPGITLASLPDAKRPGTVTISASVAKPTGPVMTATLDSLPDAPRR